MCTDGVRRQGLGFMISALMLLQALALVSVIMATPVSADVGNDPTSAQWAEDGSVFRDWVRLSADDPAADPEDWYRINLTAGATELDFLTFSVNLTGY